MKAVSCSQNLESLTPGVARKALISIFSQSLFALPLEEAIDATRSIGFQAIEIACASPHFDLEMAAKHSNRIARRIEHAGLKVSALSLFNNFTNSDTLAEQLRFADTYLGFAALFRTRVIKMTPGAPASEQATEAHWNCMKEALKQLIPLAEKFDVLLAFETHMRQLTDTLASSKRFLEMANSERVGLTLDFSNLAFAGEKMPCVVEAFRGHIYNTHLKNGYIDNVGGWHFQALNEGYIDYSELLNLLRKTKYNGYLTIECLGAEARDKPIETAARDLRILREHLALTGWNRPTNGDMR